MRVILAVVLLFATSGDRWFDHYEAGIRLIEQGQGAAARAELTAAVSMRPTEGLQIATRPQQYIDYLPHLYLAIANQMAGDVEPARRELARAEDSGLAAKSEVGRPLLVAYQLLLRGDATGRYGRPPDAMYAEKAPPLTEAEVNTLRSDGMMKCDIPPDSQLPNAPWYARYELALEL